MAKILPFVAKILPFLGQNWQFWSFLAINFQTPLIFGMEVILMVLFEKIIFYMPGKFWYGEFLAMEYQNFVHLKPVWEFSAYNFQTSLWIFLIFGMEVVLMVLFQKTLLYMLGKFWYGEIWSI